MSTPRQGRKTEARHRREKWWIGIASALAGAVITLSIVFLATAIRSTDSASDVSPTTAVHIVCPESVGMIYDRLGVPVMQNTVCGSDFVAVPVTPGIFDLQVVAKTVLQQTGTGSAKVMGNRINFDMGPSPNIQLWNDALNRATNG